MQPDASSTSEPTSTSEATSISARDLESLRIIFEETAAETGVAYFRKLVEHLARVIGTHHAFVAEFTPPQQVRTLAFWSDGQVVPNIEFDLPGTPCEEVITTGFCFYPSGVQEKYAESEPGIESYLGVALVTRDGRTLGHLCVLDEAALASDPQRLTIFRLFAARAVAELERLRLERELRESEERFADLFDEAPIAYVNEDLDSRFIRANRRAQEVLGITPDEVIGTVGKSFAPPTEDAQTRMHDAFESIGKGVNTSGVVLELRRKDNGAPIFIQWWSKPDRSGNYTRTMFIDITDQVLLERERGKLKAQNTYLQEELKSVHNFEEIIGASAGLVKVLEKVQRVAPTAATVLITGESGTGKELIARAIHSASDRADKPFIKLNCAALPASLVESELFGHERGAFSGAIQRRIGRFELAHAGTIFLDEIGEVPMDVQVKLLRVLQEREFERIGSNQTIKADVRVIAATNRDLQKSVREGDFRADLYYRLNVFPVELPPLRERQEDIPLLAQFFVQKYAPRVGRRVEGIDSEAMRRLVEYSWPGNIRELENIVERALILNNAPMLHIDADVLPKTTLATANQHAVVAASANTGSAGVGARASSVSTNDLDSIQRDHILTILRETNWVIEGSRGAASRLGLKPATMRHRMRKLSIVRSNEK